MGGLEGFRDILSNISGSFSAQHLSGLVRNLELGPASFHILTTDGSIPHCIEDAEHAFGGDLRTQVIGLTICALAHECGGHVAVRLFMHCVGPVLFPTSGGITEALHSELNDNLRRILNEGAARGLTNLFTDAINSLGVTHGDRPWLRNHLRMSDEDETFPTEIAMVGGLLKWLLQERRETYLTRSALVANVAVCLKAIGFQISAVKMWNGSDDPIPISGPHAVILVLGGSRETDPLMLDHAEVIGEAYIHHYRFSTIGAMLSNALYNQSDISPETFQTEFESIYSYIGKSLVFKWRTSSDILCPMKAAATWEPPQRKPSPMSTRLAAIYFPLCADKFAPCYDHMATQEALNEVLQHKDDIGGMDVVPKFLALFRVLTASIIISVWGRLAGNDFESIRHATTLSLNDPMWLENTCEILNKNLLSGLNVYDVAHGVAVVHAAANPETRNDFNQTNKVIGWRNGTYAVIPAIILEMAPTRDALGFRCVDYYWANSMVHSDGSIRSSSKPALMQRFDDEEEAGVIDGSSAVQSIARPHMSPPILNSADIPLYLNIERPTHYDQPDLCLCGRIDGRSIGIVGIHEVLQILIRSFEAESEKCLGHTSSTHVFAVRASQWATIRSSRPFSTTHTTFVPVKNDRCWALYLAGETSSLGGCISLGCLDCLVDKASPTSAIIGFATNSDQQEN